MQAAMLLKKKVVAAATSGFNPSMKASTVTLSNNNYTANLSDIGGAVFGLTPQSTGKWYFEIIATTFEGSNQYSPIIGIANINATLNDPWKTGGKLLWYCTGGTSQLMYGATDLRTSYATSFVQGDNIGVACDLTAGTLVFYKNGVAQPQIVIASNMTQYSVGVTQVYPLASSPHGLTSGSVVNYVKNPLYTPAGYSPW
jgi:hypothetical protein